MTPSPATPDSCVPTQTAASEDYALLSPLARWRRALHALASVFADPERTEQVLVFTSLVNSGARRGHALERFFADPRGRRLYEEQRAIDSRTIDLDALAALPADTLGHAYAQFLRSRGLTPDVFDGAPANVSDPRAAYVVQRIRQSHDLWHVVTGHDTNPGNEVALQAFTYAQLHAPSSLILSALGTVRGALQRPAIVLDSLASFRLGKRAEQLATFLWEDHWATPLADVRAMLGLPAVPAKLRIAA